MKEFTPEQLLNELKGKKIEVLPSFHKAINAISQNACDPGTFCDCSGCNNASVMIDIFDEE